jgi:DNA-binding LytR/AlgR family response regulator
MVKVLIVDDEQAALEVVIAYVQDTPFLELVAATTDPLEASQILQDHHIDLVFLDIQMPKMSGMHFLKLYEKKVKFIMTTGYEQYAIDSFEYGVVDYLTKPFSYDRFLKAVQKMPAPASMIEEKKTTRPQKVIPIVKQEREEFIFVKIDTKGKFHKVVFKDVLYMEALKTYATIYTAEDRVVCNLTLSDLQRRMPSDRFMRIHRSYMISTDKITGIEGDEVLLRKVVRVPIGDTYKQAFFDAFESTIFFKEKDSAVLADMKIVRDEKYQQPQRED